MKTGKQITVLILALAISLPVTGQEPVSLMNDDLIPWSDKGFYVSIDFRRTALAGEPVQLNGGYIAFVRKHWLSTGVAFYSTPSALSHKNRFYNLSYGGPAIQLMLNPDKLVFLSAGASGGICYLEQTSAKGKIMLFAEPEGRLWLNVASFMRISLSAAYRFVRNDRGTLQLRESPLGFLLCTGNFEMR